MADEVKVDETKKEEAPVAAKPVQDEPKKVEAEVEVPAKFKDMIEKIEKMSVLELNELVKLFEKKFGVSAQATVVSGGPAAGANDAEEKDSFDVELTETGAQKIAVIKVVKEKLGLGLKEAKDLVDAAPKILKEGMKKEEAESLKKDIEAAGGKVTLK